MKNSKQRGNHDCAYKEGERFVFRHRFIPLSLAVLTVAGARPSLGFYPNSQPAGTRQALAKIVDERLELIGTNTKPVMEPQQRERQVTVIKDGKPVPRTETYTVSVTKMVHEHTIRNVSLNEARGFGIDRKRIAVERLAELLKTPRAVLYCTSNEKVDAVYLQLVRSDTIVLVVSPPTGTTIPPLAGAGLPPSPLAAPMLAPAVNGAAAPLPSKPATPQAAPAAPAPAPGVAPAPVTEASMLDPDELFPKGTLPLAQLASLTAEGKLRLRRTLGSSTEVTAYQSVGESTTAQTLPVKVTRSSRTETTDEFDVKSVRAFLWESDILNGIDADELRIKLAKETAVLTSSDGRSIDPHYLKIIKNGTLVLIVPVATDVPAYAAPIPTPILAPAPQ